MNEYLQGTPVRLALSLALVMVLGRVSAAENAIAESARSYTAKATIEVIVTSEQGDILETKPNVLFEPGTARGVVVEVFPGRARQTVTGIGSSFTESSAFVLAHLDKESRQDVMRKIFSAEGANFSMARTPIGATDFSVEGKYAYAVAEDRALKDFSIEVDRDGFSSQVYPGIRDEAFDLLPMIREALAIKAGQRDGDLRIVASAWTAPPWMKDIGDWYVGGPRGTGGMLKPGYEPVYADYLVRYLDTYRAEGVDIWALTPVNEPEGNNGHWESMHFSPESQNEFVKSHLGPALQNGGHDDVKLLIYDQNRDQMEHWTDVILGDPETAPYVYGTAIHWYSSTFRVHEEVLERVHAKFPGFDIVHTEGTIDNLGVAAHESIADPEGYEERDWFGNDAFWWNEMATDWAYTASWAAHPEDHPMYTPVHRYARNIIVSLNHWVSGWIDWNVVLDRNGGPNHVGNFCGAPIMIDTDTGQIYYTPVFFVLAQLSRTIRPGDTVVKSSRRLAGLGPDSLHAVASLNDKDLLTVNLLNTTRVPIDFSIQLGSRFAELTIPANALQTVRFNLEGVMAD